MKQLASSLELCLCPGDKCFSNAIRAHSVQNQCVLDVLCQNGHVVMPKLDLTFDKPPTVIFRKVGRNNATTFTGLCATHDHALFQPIESYPVDMKSAHHLFLLAYRAVLKETHAARKAAIDLQLSYQKAVEKDLFPLNEPSPPGMLAVELMMAAYLVEEVKGQMGEAFLSRNWQRVCHEVTELDVGPSVAVNSMFSTGIYSEKTDGAAFITLNVFPRSGKTTVIFSYLEEHRSQALEAYGNIWSASGYYKQYLLSKLILMKCENLVIAPNLHGAFSKKQKEIITHFYERNVCGHTYDVDDPRLYLFAPVFDS